MYNRLEQLLKGVASQAPPLQYSVIETHDAWIPVPDAEALRVAEQLAVVPAPVFVAFVDYYGSAQLVRVAVIERVYMSSSAVRAARRKHLRALEDESNNSEWS